MESFRVETVAKVPGPYDVAFLPDGRMLVTQVMGELRIIENGRLLPEAVIGTPKDPAPDDPFRRVLLDVAVHPDIKTR